MDLLSPKVLSGSRGTRSHPWTISAGDAAGRSEVLHATRLLSALTPKNLPLVVPVGHLRRLSIVHARGVGEPEVYRLTAADLRSLTMAAPGSGS
jgi:hypothetical protein